MGVNPWSFFRGLIDSGVTFPWNRYSRRVSEPCMITPHFNHPTKINGQYTSSGPMCCIVTLQVSLRKPHLLVNTDVLNIISHILRLPQEVAEKCGH